jgi:hypothetical protein
MRSSRDGHRRPGGVAALALVLLAAAALALAPSPARACSVCACGDPLLDATDPAALAGRLSVSLDAETLDVASASDALPGELDRLRQDTLRLQAVWRVAPRTTLVTSVPFTHKVIETVGVVRSDVTHLGDAEVGVRRTLLERSSFTHRTVQELAVSAGTSLPTGPDDLEADGERIEPHGQPGTGGFGPFAGLHYRFAVGDVALSASVGGRWRTANDVGYRFGEALTWTLNGQWRPARRVALDLGLDARHAAPDADGGDAVPDTGGSLVAAAPAVHVRMAGGLWLSARGQIPVASRLAGTQEVGPVFVAGFSYEVLR